MNNKHNIFLLILGVLLFAGVSTMSCGPSRREREMQAELDSIRRADSLARVKFVADSIKKAELMNFTTPDLKLFNLKGYVKSARISYSGYNAIRVYDPESTLEREIDNGNIPYLSYKEYIFDENGELKIMEKDYYKIILGGYGESHHKVIRDNEGRLSKLIPNPIYDGWPEGGVYTFKYNNDGYPAAIDLVQEEGNPYMTASFNSDGLPVDIKMSGYCQFDYKYKYLEFDTHGNWTKRQVKCDFEYEGDGEDDIFTYIETRSIKYYK